MTSTPARRRPGPLPLVAVLGALPYFAFLTVFLILPIIVNLVASVRDSSGAWTLEPLLRLREDQYVSAFSNTAMLSLTTTVIGGTLGLALAWAILTTERPRWLRDGILSFSSVASQFAGIPLAFAFVALLGTQGMLTTAVAELTGWNLSESFRLSSFAGLTIVYLYFQVPLMAVLILPALTGLKREWVESAQSLGAGRARHLLDIALPILAPSVGGALLLLFANAFSAYATAYALAGGGANLVAILVGFFVSGNVMVDNSFGAALSTGMIAVVTLAMLARWLLTRRSTRWLS
ncbi:ABC transporter permease [Sediminivirga luteola]|uniref:ABC transporter n=1 Tax=Sediminivirga luteola TaxID=1774748 RepID=A0A8J2XLW4_9MICO|nr:ABC transporter permease subunit [Sediminivirga luteola]MCI2265016.1 ABC transporter permease subunit [Sediminivirga luteola]GGA25437.1 ABC transporter [Sediminivirga luteola]